MVFVSSLHSFPLEKGQTKMSDSFRCTVKAIQSPGIYWMTRYCDPDKDEYLELERRISAEIRSLKHGYMKHEIEENEIVAVQHPHHRMQYFRALVKGRFVKSSKISYKLFLIDHGTIVEADGSKIEIIVNPKFRNKEPAAFKVRLYGVVPVQPMDFDPSTGESGFKWEVSKNWMPAAMDFVIKQLNKNCEVYVRVERYMERSIIGDIFLKDEGSGSVESLADMLIDNEFAIEATPKKYVFSSSDSASASQPSDLQEIQETQAKLDRVREWRMQHMGVNDLTESEEPWNDEHDIGNEGDNEKRLQKETENVPKDDSEDPTVKSARKSLLTLLRTQKSKSSASPEPKSYSPNSESLKTPLSSPLSESSSKDANQKLLKMLSSCKSRSKVSDCDDAPYDTDDQNSFSNAATKQSSIKIVLNKNDVDEDEENDFDFEPNMAIKRSEVNLPCHLSQAIRESVKPKIKPEHVILPAGKVLPEQTKHGSEKRLVESDKRSSDDEEEIEFEPWVLVEERLADAIDTFKDNQFVPEVSINLEKMKFMTLLPLQRWSIPSIDRGINVVMISPRNTGKTVAYVVQVINSVLSEEDLEGNEIFSLILCSSSKNADFVKELCLSLLGKASKSKIKILAVGNENLNDLKSKNYHILITTPSIFINFMSNSMNNLATLRYFVLDGADKMKESDVIVKSILKGIPHKLFKKQCSAIIAGRKWTSDIDQIIDLMQKKFAIFMADAKEVAVYNEVKSIVYFATDETLKAQIVLNELRKVVDKRKILIMCNNIEEVLRLTHYFTTIGRMALIVHEKRNMQLVKDDLQSWTYSKKDSHRILLCTYGMMDKVEIKETDYLVYYSLPASKEELENSLAYLNDTFRKCSKTEECAKKALEEHCLMVLVDGTYSKNLPVIIDLAKRLGAKIPPEVSDLVLNPPKLVCKVPEKKLEYKIDKKRDNIVQSKIFDSEDDYPKNPPKLVCKTPEQSLKTKVHKIHDIAVSKVLDWIDDKPKEAKTASPVFCTNVLETGICKMKNCTYRHNFQKELDAPKLHVNGKVIFKIVYVENPISYWARLLEHEDENTGEVTVFKDRSVEINIKLLNFYEAEQHRKRPKSIKVGDIVGVKCDSDLFYRGQILELIKKYEEGEIIAVKVRRLERGDFKIIKVHQIYKLPHDILRYPPQVSHICLSNIARGEQDEEAVNLVRNLIQNAEQEKYSWSGRILFSVNYTLWLNTFEAHSVNDMYIDKLSIRDLFLEKHWVQENLDHLNHLYELFEESGIEYKRVEEEEKIKEKKKKFKLKPKPNWEGFDEKFSRVIFLGAENTSSIFLQKPQFKKKLEQLELECQKESERIKDKFVDFSIEEGDFVLAYTKGKRRWRRGMILSQTASGIDVFFVDHGEAEHVQRSDILPLAKTLMNTLPFQAIECSLVGIKHSSDECDPQVFNEIYNFCDLEGIELCANVISDNLKSRVLGSRKYDINLLNFEGKSLNKILIDNSLARCLRSERCFARDFDEISLENLDIFDLYN